MEQFVIAIVLGGLALVGGLWLLSLLSASSLGWLVGLSLVAIGCGALGWGIWTQLAIERPTG